MSFKRAKTVNTLLTISLKWLFSAFLLNGFIKEGTGNFEEIEIKLGEGWGQERPLCNLKWKSNCMQSYMHISAFIFEAVHQAI